MDQATLDFLILKEIRKAKEISRRDLSNHLNIAKSTAGRRVDLMMERGLVEEIGIEERKEAGRPRRFLALRADFGGFIGIDFDSRNLFAILTTFDQTAVIKKKISLPVKQNKEDVLARIRELIAEFTANEAGLPILGVGISVPGHVNREDRISINSRFIDKWKNVDLLKELGLAKELLHIENYTRAVALGEYWHGPYIAAKYLVCVSVRAGITAAFIANGELVAGRNEMAGEIHGWKVPTGDPDSPTSESLEEVGTIQAITNGIGVRDESWPQFLKDCREGQEEALELLSNVTAMHGDAAARIVQLLDPEIIIFSGPFTELEDIYLDRVRRATSIALKGHYFVRPPIERATLGEFAGAHGAAALAASETRLL